MSNKPASGEPTGAIDNDFAANEREARDQITAALADHNRAVEPGDFAIDLVYHRPVFVNDDVAETCVAYWKDGEDFDLTTYKAHPYLPITVDDTVFECVYVPTKPGDVRHEPADKTYDFPSGRLMRVPVEHLWDSKTRWLDNRLAAFVAAVAANLEARDVAVDSETFDMVVGALRGAVGDDAVDDGLRRAGIEPAEDDDFDGGDA
jgi:hypothetical protein